MNDLPPLDWCLGGYALLTLLCLGAVTLKYRSIFHPLLFVGLQLFVQACLAPWAQDRARSLLLPQSWWIGASLLTALYLFGLTWPMLTRVNPFLPLCEMALGPWEVSRKRMGTAGERTPLFLCRAYSGVLLAFSAFFFALLVRDSSAGTLWLTDPRTAYMFGRSGSGHWYVLSQTCLFLSYLTWLYYLRPRNRVVMLSGTLMFAALMFYFGSKAGMVGVVVAGGVYFNYFVRLFSWQEVALAAGLGVPVVLVSPWLQGNFDSLKETLQYYDYFDNAARYVGRDDQFGPQYGGSFLNSLWEYIPRRIAPDKPYVYGTIIVNEYFYEGAAKTGYTPGYLPWITYHLDFNIPGVFIAASLIGFANKAVYTYFLRHRSFLGFLSFLQVAFVPVLRLAPVLYFVALLFGLAVSLRLFLYAGKVVLGIEPSHTDSSRDSLMRRILTCTTLAILFAAVLGLAGCGSAHSTDPNQPRVESRILTEEQVKKSKQWLASVEPHVTDGSLVRRPASDIQEQLDLSTAVQYFPDRTVYSFEYSTAAIPDGGFLQFTVDKETGIICKAEQVCLGEY